MRLCIHKICTHKRTQFNVLTKIHPFKNPLCKFLSLQFSFAQSSNFITAKSIYWRPYFWKCKRVCVETKVLSNENYITLGCTTWKRKKIFKNLKEWDFLHFYTTPPRLMLYEALRENEIFIIFNVSDNWNELWAEMLLPS